MVWAQILTEGGASVTRSAVVPEWSRQRWKCTSCSWSGEVREEETVGTQREDCCPSCGAVVK
eukprot:11936495-Prorocentrum_lima.AAC.1